MGCTTIKTIKPDKAYMMPETQTKIGLLTIEILSGYIHSHSGLTLLQPEAKFKVSNFEFTAKIPKQSIKSSIQINSSKTVLKSQSQNSVIYTVPINSLYKFHGRALQIEITEQPSKVQNYSGLGIMDLDPYLKQQCLKKQAKCFINYDRKSGGYVNMLISFQEVQSQLLLLRLDTIFISNSNNRNKTVKARVTIGQEILQTSYKTDNPNSSPSWKNQILMFKIPKPVTSGSIQILEKVENKKTKLLGRTLLDIEKISFNEQRNILKQEIVLNGSSTGSILFEIIQTLEHLEQITQCSKGKIFISNLNGKLTSLNSLPKSSFKDLPRTETHIRSQLFTKSKAKTSKEYISQSNNSYKTLKPQNTYGTDFDIGENTMKKRTRKNSKRVSISDRLSQQMNNCEKQNQYKQCKQKQTHNFYKMLQKQVFCESPRLQMNDDHSWNQQIKINMFQP